MHARVCLVLNEGVLCFDVAAAGYQVAQFLVPGISTSDNIADKNAFILA